MKELIMFSPNYAIGLLKIAFILVPRAFARKTSINLGVKELKFGYESFLEA